MARFYYDKDIDLDTLQDMTVGVIGYGNQGRAHALNLKDSGLSVRVGMRAASGAREQAEQDGFLAETIEEVAANCEVLAVMLPDETMPAVYSQSIEPYITSDKAFVFAHGFCVHNRTLRLPEWSDVLLVAPTGPGKQLRSLYLEGRGLPALVAVEQDQSGMGLKTALAYAKGIGCARAGVIQTTFKEETTTDLFCEQAVLCGGLPELIKSSFETLTEAGYQPELAYISCLKEVKLIADLLFQTGIYGMRSAISNTAKFGSCVAGPRIIDEHCQSNLRAVLHNIESGAFAKAFLSESKAGSPETKTLLETERQSHLARVGDQLKEKLDF